MADLLPVDTASSRLAGLPPIAALDVPLAVVEAATRLRHLQETAPAGHGEPQQPADWYELAFDALITAHPETCRKAGGQS
ncbi:hypothetical protein ABTX82_01490 [Streptomyces lavendulae]|uniref:hypothetical protein n=1 Tax=Streptomyces lavendulae TaxID=1914 RepID=UPI00331BA213